MRFSNKFKKVPYLLQALLNVCLFFLAIALSALLISQTWYIVQSESTKTGISEAKNTALPKLLQRQESAKQLYIVIWRIGWIMIKHKKEHVCLI